MDEGTGLAILGSALGSAKVLEKLLGPTAAYIGEGIKIWAEKRVTNVQNIFRVAVRRLGGKINEPGTIPPRVLKGIFDDGSFCDDPLMVEYFGGALASSRTDSLRDDRAVMFINLISGLSTYQIRSHYIFYTLFYRDFKGSKLPDIYTGWSGTPILIFVPFDAYKEAMDLQDSEDVISIAAHSLMGLARHDLIDGFAYGEAEKLKRYANANDTEAIKNSGLAAGLSVIGAELFSFVHGKSNFQSVNDFLNPEMNFEQFSGIKIPDCKTKLPIREEYKKHYTDSILT